MGRTFETRRLVRHGHTDAAGIVFYPRYYELIAETIEDFFGQALGLPFGDMHVRRRVGVPTVRIETEFHAPSYCDDELLFSLVVAKLGRSSATLEIKVTCNGEPRMTTRQTIAQVMLDDMRSVPFADELREQLGEYAKDGAA